MTINNPSDRRIGIGDALLDHLVVILILAIAGLGLGLAASQKVETHVEATTSILLTPLEGNPFYPSNRGEDLLNLNSEAQALKSDSVAERAAKKLGVSKPSSEMLGGLSVTVPMNTQILDVSYRARNPEKAKEFSQAFADAYLSFRHDKATNRIDTQLKQLDQEIKSNTDNLNALALQLADPKLAAVQEASIRQQMDSLTSQNANLKAKRAELATTPLNPGQVVVPAQQDRSGLVSMRLIVIVLGGIFGLGLGTLIALIRSRSDIRIQAASSLLDSILSPIATIGDLPPSTPDAGPLFEEQIEDEYRRLRVATIAHTTTRPASILIASASGDSRSPVTVADLAVSLARSAVETVVIDATTHGIGPSFILGNDLQIGLSDVITRRATFDQAVTSVGSLLWVIGPGSDPSRTTDLLSGVEMSRVMSLAFDRADVVVIATDSIQGGTAQALATSVQHILIEVDQGRTTSVEVARVIRVLELLTCSVMGSIFLTESARVRSTPFTPHVSASRGELPKSRTTGLPTGARPLGPIDQRPTDTPPSPELPSLDAPEHFEDGVPGDDKANQSPSQRNKPKDRPAPTGPPIRTTRPVPLQRKGASEPKSRAITDDRKAPASGQQGSRQTRKRTADQTRKSR